MTRREKLYFQLVAITYMCGPGLAQQSQNLPRPGGSGAGDNITAGISLYIRTSYAGTYRRIQAHSQAFPYFK
jgi:hypothetical protein